MTSHLARASGSGQLGSGAGLVQHSASTLLPAPEVGPRASLAISISGPGSGSSCPSPCHRGVGVGAGRMEVGITAASRKACTLKLSLCEGPGECSLASETEYP